MGNDQSKKDTSDEIAMNNSDSLSRDLSVDAVPFIPGSTSDKSCDSLPDFEIVKQVQKAASQALSSIEKQTDSGIKNEIDFKIKKYIELGLMPLELKYGYKDAVILCSDNDLSEVEQFRSSLESKMLLLGREKPKIALFSEIEITHSNQFRALEFALDRCTFVFLFITSSFVTDAWVEYSSEACLMDSISNPKKRWSVVPVFTDKREKSGYKIPISINTLKGVTYWSGDDFYVESIRKLFEDRISVRKEREREEGTMQRAWLFQYEKDMHEKEIREKQEQLKDRARLEELKQQKATLDHSLSMPVIAPPVPESAPHTTQHSKSFAGPNPTDEMILDYIRNNPNLYKSFAQGSKVSAHAQSTCVRTAAEHTEPAVDNLEDLSLKQKSTLVCNPTSSKDDKRPVESASDFSSSVDYESFAAAEEKDENANDELTEDCPVTSGAASAGSSKIEDKKVLQYVQAIHHHHHHEVKNYHVTADNVQIGGRNKLVLKKTSETYSENQQCSEEMDDEEDDRTEYEDEGGEYKNEGRKYKNHPLETEDDFTHVKSLNDPDNSDS
ncbi:uncharacterized protein LOC126819703 [Patella vulgata]|uniref:uncharacterized protein LOC126819703 n=1 Tax=Patella vulgata TaxID=6465 RepID=UPI0024A81BEB|nr:uncharacterized protein LOC126819703 [Patella vulgata]XP_050403859.2 uncharacterized protein LOC126819703 [Patella vulgata]XP_055956105.1 uncharacterized protein LOC126819703 [Patella vulgata]